MGNGQEIKKDKQSNETDDKVSENANTNIVRNVEEAIKEIKKAYRKGYYNEEEFPYFFIVGAGISTPQVKLASQIVQECRNLCKDEYKDNEEISPSKEYSTWFERAFPHREMRRIYLTSLIKKENKLPKASLKLAQILSSKKITNLVVTTNFDKYIYEALNLYREKNVLVADCPQAVSKLNMRKDCINILHVHGTYEFYSLCNLQDELEGVANNNEFFSVKSFLRNVLVEKSPIIVGYSGWEEDVIMSVIKERLKLPLKHKLYWFCYSENDLKKLPNFLKNKNEDVVFVLPDNSENGKNALEEIAAAEQNSTVRVIEDRNNYKNINNEQYIESNNINKISNLKPVLEANTVFDNFIRSFDIKMPKIINNPIKFLKDYYKETLENNYFNLISLGLLEYSYNLNADQKEDIIRIKECIYNRKLDELVKVTSLNNIKKFEGNNDLIREILKCIEIYISESENINNNQELFLNYEEIYNNVLDSKMNIDKIRLYRVRIEKVKKFISLGEQYSELKKSVFDILDELMLFDENDEEMYDLLCEIIELVYNVEKDDQIGIDFYNKILKGLKGSKGKKYYNVMIEAKRRIAEIYKNNGEYKKAFIEYEELINMCKDLKYEKFKFIILHAYLSKAYMYYNIGKITRAIEEYNNIIENYDMYEDQEIKIIVLNARIFMASDMSDDGNVQQAIKEYNKIIEKCDKEENDEIKIIAVNARIYKAIDLSGSGNAHEAIEEYSEVIERYDKEEDQEIRIAVLNARIFRASDLSESGKTEEAIEEYNKIMGKYGMEENEEIKILVSKAKINKAIELSNQEKKEQALQEYDEIIEKYEGEVNDEIRATVVTARLEKAIDLSNQGKKEEAIMENDNIIEKYENEENEDIKIMVVTAMINKAIDLSNQNKEEKAVQQYNKVIEKYITESNEPIKVMVVKAMVYKSKYLSDNGNSELAISGYDEVIKKYENEEKQEIKELVIKSKVSRLDNLLGLENSEQIIDEYNKIIDEYKNEENEKIKKYVIECKINKIIELIKVGKINEIHKEYKKIINEDISEQERLIVEIILKIIQLSQIQVIVRECKASIVKDGLDIKIMSLKMDRIGYRLHKYNNEFSANFFYLAYELDNVNGNNLAYMIRRNEIKDISNYPSCEKLLKCAIENKQGQAIINQALIFISNKQYRQAIEITKQIDDANTDVFNWWIIELDDEEIEKYIVWYIAIVTNKIQCSNEQFQNIEKKLSENNMDEMMNDLKGIGGLRD